MNKVKYLPHPCSAETKQEWNAKGYRVVDERFSPIPAEQEKPKRKQKKAAE